MNENAVTRAIAQVEERLAECDDEAIRKMDEAAVIDEREWLAFADLPSYGLAMGVLNSDEAQTLAEIHSRFDQDGGPDLAEAIVFLSLMSSLLRLKDKGLPLVHG